MSPAAYRKRLIERLAARVDKSGGPDACWPWTGSLYEGYGKLGVRSLKGRYRYLSVHVVAWALESRRWPSGRTRIVCHTCGNRACCQPKHLYLGTQKSNADDRVAHGNQHRGPRILTEDQVREARRRWATDEWLQYELAEEFGVSTSLMNYILAGRSYPDVK